MRRNLFNFFAAASLLVSVAALSLWIRGALSPVRYDRRELNETGSRRDFVSLGGGVVAVSVLRERPDAPLSLDEIVRIRDRESRLARISPSTMARQALGERPWSRMPATAPAKDDILLYSFASRVTRLSRSEVSQWSLRFRLWPVVVFGAVMPGVWVGRRMRQTRRVGMGQCVFCGYDMRATPNRCPECGTVPQPPHNPAMQRTATASSGAVE